MRASFQEVSRGGSPTSMGEGSSARTCGPVRRRIRTARGDTNWMEKGSAGLMAYSPSGKVTPSNGRNTFSMLRIFALGEGDAVERAQHVLHVAEGNAGGK